MGKILIVEDDKELAAVLAFHLRKHKHLVFVCYDAAQALSLIHKEVPDILILDIKIPAGTGLSLAENINNSPFSGMPFIFMSAFFNEDIEERASQLGAKAFIEKPFDLNKLQSLLESVELILREATS